MKVKKNEDYLEIDLGISKEKLIPIFLIIFSLIINLYYFNVNTGVWWDEAEYLGFVNHLVKGSAYSMWEGRAILYPLLLSVFGFINSSEVFLRIGLLVINSTTILFIYLTLKELFNEKISIISTILLLTNPLFIFFSHRFLTSIPSLMFMLIGVYFFLKKGYKNRILCGLFIGCAIATRFTSIFIIPALVLYDLIKRSELKKYVWIPALLLGFIPTIMFDLTQGNAPWTTLTTFLTQSTKERTWGHNLGEWTFYISNIPSIIGMQNASLWIWIIIFLTGVLITIIKIQKALGKVFKNKKGDENGAVLILISVFSLIHFLMYSFITPLKETRYMIPILPFLYSIFSIGLINLSNSFKKIVKKSFGVTQFNYILIILLIIIFSFNSIKLSHTMIHSSADSYSELRYAGELIKSNTNPDEVIMTNAGPHIAYHAERQVTGFSSNLTSLYNQLNNTPNINLLVFSFYETPPDYINEFNNNTNFTLVKQYTRDESMIVAVLAYLRE